MIQQTEGPEGSGVNVDVDASKELNERRCGSQQSSPLEPSSRTGGTFQKLEPSSRTGGTQPSCKAPPPSAHSPKATLKLL